MALNLDANNLFGVPAKSASASDRPSAKVWLNIGFPHTYKENGEVKETFVSLPFGLAIDTMELRKVSGSNVNFRNLVAAGNALLEKLQQAGQGLEAGQSEIINGLSIQLLRVNDEVPQTESDIIMPDLTFGK